MFLPFSLILHLVLDSLFSKFPRNKLFTISLLLTFAFTLAFCLAWVSEECGSNSVFRNLIINFKGIDIVKSFDLTNQIHERVVITQRKEFRLSTHHLSRHESLELLVLYSSVAVGVQVTEHLGDLVLLRGKAQSAHGNLELAHVDAPRSIGVE